ERGCDGLTDPLGRARDERDLPPVVDVHGQDSSGWSGAARPAPLAAVDHLVEGSARATGRPPGTIAAVGVADGDGADGPPSGGHAEPCTQHLLAPEDAEEEGAEPGVDH